MVVELSLAAVPFIFARHGVLRVRLGVPDADMGEDESTQGRSLLGVEGWTTDIPAVQQEYRTTEPTQPEVRWWRATGKASNHFIKERVLSRNNCALGNFKELLTRKRASTGFNYDVYNNSARFFSDNKIVFKTLFDQ